MSLTTVIVLNAALDCTVLALLGSVLLLPLQLGRPAAPPGERGSAPRAARRPAPAGAQREPRTILATADERALG